jgi:hypothetical protein
MNYEDLMNNHATQMIERLVTEILTQEAVDVRFDYEDNEQWSQVTIHIYEEDNEISLRLHPGDRFKLYFGYYDDKDDFHEIIKELTPEEANAIPKALRKAMAKVLADEEGLRLPGNFLTR